MNQIRKIAGEEYIYQRNILDRINEVLSAEVEGRVIEKKYGGKSSYYYEYRAEENGRMVNKRRAFAPGEAAKKEMLIKRRAAKKLRRQVEKNCRLLASVKEEYSEIDINLVSALIPRFSNAEKPEKHLFADKNTKWKLSFETDPDFRPEGRIHEYGGRKYRSKGELIIAMRLLACGLIFVPEPVLTLGRFRYHPDFAVINARTGQIFFWEHLGMMDKPEYRENFAKKIEAYAEFGIFLNYNLIVTCEYPGMAEISVAQIDSIIKAWLL